MMRKMVAGNLAVMFLFLAGITTFAETKEKKSEIIVGFVKDTPQKDITSFQKKYNLKVIKPFKRICAVRYLVAPDEEYKKKISEIKEEKIVRYVEMNTRSAKKKK